jgi:hypothetical protein
MRGDYARQERLNSDSPLEGCTKNADSKTAATGFLFEYAPSFLDIVCGLNLGFALGYGVREWMFRRERSQQRRRRPF